MTTFNPTAEAANNITTASLAAVRSALEANDIVGKAFTKKLDRWSQLSRITIEWFIANNTMDDHLVSILNKLKNEKNLAGALNSMAIRMTTRSSFNAVILKQFPAIYAIEYSKLVLAGTLIDALGFMGELAVEIKDGKYKNPITGRIETYTSNWYLFQLHTKEIFDAETGLPEGLKTTAGELGGSKLNLHTWEKDRKFNRDQKDFLRDSSSMAFRLIDHTKEWWTAMFKESQWYTEALKLSNKGLGESRAALNDRVNELVKGIMGLYVHDRLYFTYTFQISGRLQAVLSTEGIAPQGSGKLAWELADAVLVTLKMKQEARIDAAKMWQKAQDRTNISTTDAKKVWTRKRAAILAWLISNDHKMKDESYAQGLSEIILAPAKATTHRMIGRDLATNGVAIAASNYRCESLGDITNISGSAERNDSHGVVATMLGYNDRDEVKKLGITAGLFHGQGVKGIAKKAGMPLREMILGLDKAFGKKWTYFSRIASYVGQNMIDNMHTSTKMKSPEGWDFINQAYAERSEVKVTIFSFETDSNIREIDIIKNMPILFNAKGFPINILYVDPDGNVKNNGKIKLSGAYANSIHMLDAWMLREVLRRTKAVVHTVHDNFYLAGDKLDSVAQVIKSCHVKMWKNNYLQGNINYMAANSHIDIAPINLATGHLTIDQIKASTEFLQA